MFYRNFDIYIGERTAAGYTVRAESRGRERSRGLGEARGTLVLDPADPQLVRHLERLDERETDRAFLEELGILFYASLFDDEIESLLQKSLGAAQSQPDLGLRLRLRIDPPGIAALPWELTYSSSERGYLATRINSPVVRYQEMARAITDLSTALPLRMLVAIPEYSPRFEAVSAGRERRVIEDALKDMRDAVEIDFFEGKSVTWDGLDERLREGQHHCFHFIGHGTFQKDRGYVVLAGSGGEDEIVADERFAHLFTNLPSIRLVVLNACQGATASSSHALAGTAAHMVSEGVPAVVAMQFSVLDKAAIKFARTFYRSLFRGHDSGRVDVAISHARHALRSGFPDQREMATPVLVTHASDGVLFVPERESVWTDMRRPGSLTTAGMQQGHALGLLRKASRDRPDDPALAGQIDAAGLELARIRRRIAEARLGLLTAFCVGMIVFSMFWVRALDVFTLDTRAELAIMAFGDVFAEPVYSELIRPVGLKLGGRPLSDKRRAVATALQNLGRAGARLVVLDFFYTTSDGRFASEQDAGMQVVEAIRSIAPGTGVVVAAIDVAGGRLATPESMRQAALAVGHACVESKLGLARSLPISIESDGRQLPSLALATVAAYRGGEASPDVPATIVFPGSPGAPPVTFAASEVEQARQTLGPCQVAAEGSEVVHRFFRLWPVDLEARPLVDGTESLSRDLADPGQLEGLRAQFAGKIAVLGELGGKDVVADRTSTRPGLLWQADAINNLLLDEFIRPMKGAAQFAFMLVLAGVGATLALSLLRRRSWSLVLLVVTTAIILLGVVYTYSAYKVLFNPLYHIVALWLAWWVARKVGVRWFP